METLASGRALTDDEAARIVAVLYQALTSDELEMLWDDAYDSLDLLTPSHVQLVPHLCEVANQGDDMKVRLRSFRLVRGSRENYPQGWAIRAIGRIGGSAAVACLTELEGKIDPRFAPKVKRALANCRRMEGG